MTLVELTDIRAPRERCFDLARSVEVHLAGNVHGGEQAVAEAKHFGVRCHLTSRITHWNKYLL